MRTHILSMTYGPKIVGREIKIPFKDRFDSQLVNDIKVRTWRTRMYGVPGDWFERKGHQYVLTIVEKACMGSVPVYWEAEGFCNPEDAIQTLKEIFPENGYQADRMGWAHWFKRIGGQPSTIPGDTMVSGRGRKRREDANDRENTPNGGPPYPFLTWEKWAETAASEERQYMNAYRG